MNYPRTSRGGGSPPPPAPTGTSKRSPPEYSRDYREDDYSDRSYDYSRSSRYPDGPESTSDRNFTEPRMLYRQVSVLII